MNTLYPTYTILPGKTRVSVAVRQANAAGVDLWLTGRGQVILAPIGRPGWRRLNIRTVQEVA
jgi:hypothetical protein